jgi:lipopolysaccharide exporter
MQFQRHISKGMWALADKGMLALYGVAFMLIVIRTLSPEQYGTLFLFQTVFLLITSLATSFAIQPMIKYVAEGSDPLANSSTTLVITTLFVGLCSGIILLLSHPVALVLDAQHAQALAGLFSLLPILFAANIYKLVASGLLQARLQIKQLFIVDCVYLLSSLAFIIIAQVTHNLSSADIVVYIMVVSSLLASAVALYLVRAIVIPTWRWDQKEAVKIFDFGKYSLGGTVGNVVQTQFDTLLISAFSGVGGVAIYGAAKSFTRVFDMFAQSIQMLVIPASSMLYARGDKEGLTALVEKSICFSLLAVLPVVAIYVFFPGVLVWLIYGDKYAESVPVLRVLALTGLLVPWGAVIASILYGTGRTAMGFMISIASLLLSLVVYYVSGSIAGLSGIVWGVVAVNAILIFTVGIYVLRRLVSFRMVSMLHRTKDAIQFLRTWKQQAKTVFNQ